MIYEIRGGMPLFLEGINTLCNESTGPLLCLRHVAFNSAMHKNLHMRPKKNDFMGRDRDYSRIWRWEAKSKKITCYRALISLPLPIYHTGG